MSILIKGMEMPHGCAYCYKPSSCLLWLDLDEMQYRNCERHKDCPIFEIPTPHGDLIEKESLILHLNDYQFQQAPFNDEPNDVWLAIGECMKAVEDAPTVVESED